MVMTEFSLSPLVEVADQIFVAVAEPAGVTIGVVAGPRGCLVIDTGSSPAQGAAIRSAAEATTGKPVVAAVVTHWHYDHLFGLAAFADLPSYGHQSVSAWLGRPEAAQAAAELGVAVADLAAPSITLALAKVIDVGGRRVEVLHFGPAHTDGDLVVYVPDADVVFAGDLVESAGPPSFGPDCRLREWPIALDGILGMTREASRILPGHGQEMNRVEVFEQRARIAALHGQVAFAISQGKKLDDAYEGIEWPFDEATIRSLLPIAYAQFADAGITPKRQLPLLGS